LGFFPPLDYRSQQEMVKLSSTSKSTVSMGSALGACSRS
jgi:hypothetical protein